MRFWHRLALAIGGCTVEELQGRMSQVEFVRWKVFSEREPIGAARADLHNAMQMLLHVSINRRKGDRKPKLEQFLPDWWDDSKSPAALEQKLRSLAPASVETVKGEPGDGANTRDTDSQTRGRRREVRSSA